MEIDDFELEEDNRYDPSEEIERLAILSIRTTYFLAKECDIHIPLSQQTFALMQRDLNEMYRGVEFGS